MLDRIDVAGFSVVLGALTTVLFGYPIFWRRRHRLLPHVPTLPFVRPFFLPLAVSRALFVTEVCALCAFYLALVFVESESARGALLSGCVLVHFVWMFFWLAVDEFVQTPQLVFLTLGLLSAAQPQLNLWDMKLTFFFMYLHGGAQKQNVCFYDQWPSFFGPLLRLGLGRSFRVSDALGLTAQRAVGCALATVESLLAVPLLFDLGPLTHAAVLGLLGMHVVILAAIGPHVGPHAAGVWPWNVACIFALPAAFWMRDVAPDPTSVLANGSVVAVLLWAGLFPCFGYGDAGYPQLSWVMYAYNTPDAEFYLERRPADHDLTEHDGHAVLSGRYIDYHTLTRCYHVTPLISRTGNVKLAAWLADQLGVETTLHYTHRPDRRTGTRQRSKFVFEPATQEQHIDQQHEQ